MKIIEKNIDGSLTIKKIINRKKYRWKFNNKKNNNK
jgi:hypothetical protein